jgi:hypothetical protein
MALNDDTVGYLRLLMERCPFLLPLLWEHLDDYDGTVLPHLLIADVERWAEAEVGAGVAPPSGSLVCLLDMIELAAAEPVGSLVRELVAASFLEHLPRQGLPGAELRGLVGPTSTRLLEIIG